VEKENVPHFVVVGHPNKGKSTIVATLSYDDSVEIDELPGTTTVCSYHPLKVNSQTLYYLVDTPGFQRPHKVLEYLQNMITPQTPPTLSNRRQLILNLLSDQTARTRFSEEIEILSSLMTANAHIVYVVDGGVPYSSEYEAEMEIIQWTGQPRLALINPLQSDDFVSEWEMALRHYFGIIKVFNPLISSFSAKNELLKAFGQLNSNWSDSLNMARKALKEYRVYQQEQSANAIIDSLMSVLYARVSVPIDSEEDSPNQRQLQQSALKEKLEEHLRTIEADCWGQLNNIFNHRHLKLDKNELEILECDLFSKESRTIFGLSTRQMLFFGLMSGGTAGLAIDAAVGGSSFLLGSLLGAGIGASTAYLGTDKLLEFSIIRLLNIGSHSLTATISNNLNMAFIFLNRALTYYFIISERSHGNRHKCVYQDTSQKNQHLSDKDLFNKLKSVLVAARRSTPSDKTISEMKTVLLEIMK
jgi:hypothetical protein